MNNLFIKFVSVSSVVLMAQTVFAGPVTLCGDVERLRVWASSHSNNSIRIEYRSNPEQCPGGFFMVNDHTNTDRLYSLFLSAKASSQEVCIQTYPDVEGWVKDGFCKVNYGMHK